MLARLVSKMLLSDQGSQHYGVQVFVMDFKQRACSKSIKSECKNYKYPLLAEDYTISLN